MCIVMYVYIFIYIYIYRRIYVFKNKAYQHWISIRFWIAREVKKTSHGPGETALRPLQHHSCLAAPGFRPVSPQCFVDHRYIMLYPHKADSS